MAEETLIHSGEVARRLGLTRHAVMALVRRGELPAVKVSSRLYRFNWEDVERCVRRLPGRLAEEGPK